MAVLSDHLTARSGGAAPPEPGDRCRHPSPSEATKSLEWGKVARLVEGARPETSVKRAELSLVSRVLCPHLAGMRPGPGRRQRLRVGPDPVLLTRRQRRRSCPDLELERKESLSRAQAAKRRPARPTSLTSGAAVHRPTAPSLTRRTRLLVLGVLQPCVSLDVPDEGREAHHRAGISFPPVGVGRMAAPTVLVRLVSLPKTIDHVGALSRRGQLGHERPEHLC